MKEILLSETVNITRKKNIYKIEFKYNAYSMINSIINTNIIIGGSTDETYKTIIFSANSVKTLKKYQEDKKLLNGKKCLLVSDVARMIRSLSIQLNYLIESESSTIIGYNPNDIIVINDEKFAFLGSELVANIETDSEMAMISCPYSSSDFFYSPEILRIKEIPSLIHYKTAYFSLALLIIYTLIGETDFYIDYLHHKESEKILEVLNSHPVKKTRIFWLLYRCLVEEVKNRSIILI